VRIVTPLDFQTITSRRRHAPQPISTGTALKRICKSSQRMKPTGLHGACQLGERKSQISHALLKSEHGEFTSFGKDFIVLLVWFLGILARWKLGEFHSRDLLRRNDATHLSEQVVEN
jgi:hypothetical protein